MATMIVNRVKNRASPVPRALRQQVEPLLAESYAYMDSPIFRQRNLEKQLFSDDAEKALPLVAWYQPTREELESSTLGAPQLMSTKEEQLMFRRFNFCKRRLVRLQKLIKREGLTRERAEQFLEWHRRFEHY